MKRIEVNTASFTPKVTVKPVSEADGTITGKEWDTLIIQAGQSLNGGMYPKDVLHRDKRVFEGVPVFANSGPDHDFENRGSRSIAGWVHSVEDHDDGIAARVHISEAALASTMVDLASHGKLDEFMGLSIVAYGMWEFDTDNPDTPPTLVEFTKGESVDIVRHPAAGGKFVQVAESIKEAVQRQENSRTEGTVMTEAEIKALMESDGLKDVLKDIVGQAASTAVATALSERKEESEESDAKEAPLKVEKTNAPDDAKDLRFDSFLVANDVKDSKLPSAAQGLVLETFSGKPYDAAKVAEAIKQQRDYLASLETVVAETVTKQRGQVVIDARDKVIHRIDATFEESGKIDIDGVNYPGFRKFTEMWAAWSGTATESIDKKTMAKRFMEGIDGYDSADVDQQQRITESSLQQSDLGEVTADRMHKSLLRQYANFPQYQDWRRIARVGQVDDYQAYRRLKFGGYANLAVVAEKGIYPDLAHPTDEETTITLRKKGGIAPQITRELIINDNVGAISLIPSELALSASRTLYEEVFDILTANATYSVDSVALFHSSHGANTGTTALSLAGVDVASVAMRSQTRALATANTLGAQNEPRLLVVPNELTGLAERIANPSQSFHLTATADTEASDNVDRWSNRLEVITCDYFTDATEHYFVADPKSIMGIEVVFLGGQEEPELFFQRGNEGEGWTMDVESIKIRHEYRTGLHDFRPFYRST